MNRCFEARSTPPRSAQFQFVFLLVRPLPLSPAVRGGTVAERATLDSDVSSSRGSSQADQSASTWRPAGGAPNGGLSTNRRRPPGGPLWPMMISRRPSVDLGDNSAAALMNDRGRVDLIRLYLNSLRLAIWMWWYNTYDLWDEADSSRTCAGWGTVINLITRRQGGIRGESRPNIITWR